MGLVVENLKVGVAGLLRVESAVQLRQLSGSDQGHLNVYVSYILGSLEPIFTIRQHEGEFIYKIRHRWAGC